MRFLIIGDLHGHMPKISRKDFDAIIAPGDFCSDAPRKYMFQALKLYLKDPKSKTSWYDIVGKRKARQMVKKSLADGRRVLEFLNSFDVPVFIVPGNWDWTKETSSSWTMLQKDHYASLHKGLKNIHSVYHKCNALNDISFVGHGITSGPEYPQKKKDLERIKAAGKLAKTKRKFESIKKKLDKCFSKARKPTVFLSHNVPYNTKVDSILMKSSPRFGEHFGSVVAREMILKHKPLVCIGGHMHEHFGKCTLGKTTVINAGYGAQVNTILEINKNKITELQFYRNGRKVRG